MVTDESLCKLPLYNHFVREDECSICYARNQFDVIGITPYLLNKR